MTNQNTLYWDQLKVTPETALKHGTLNGQQIKSINGTYFSKKATEIWGPFGKGWGYTIIEDSFKDGKPIYNANNNLLCHEVMHTIKLSVWYMDEGVKIECPPHFGHTPYILSTSYGPKTDFEAPKKSLTDAMKKSFSMLGFAADVYSGEWDDVTEVELESRKHSTRVEKREDEATENLTSFLSELEAAVKGDLPALRTQREVEGFRTKWIRKANKQPQPASFVKVVNERSDKRIEEIKSAKAAATEEKE